MSRKLRIGLIALLMPCLVAAEPVTFVCTYQSFSNEDGNRAVTGEFVLTFLLDGEKAYMIGNQGTTELAVAPQENGVSFVEITPSGNVMATTIAADGSSVHSRNTILLGELVPSQYYGQCEIRS